jgi:V/A-type H+-transporting ATPase subunit I
MKEILLFTSTHSVGDTVLHLGELGVVDIKEIKKSSSGPLERRKTDVEQTENAISILKDYSERENQVADRQTYSVQYPKQLVERVLKAEEIKKKCQERLQTLSQQLNWYLTWGEKLDVRDIAKMKKKGIHLRLYYMKKAAAASIDQKHTVVKLPEYDDLVPVVLITRNKSETLPFGEEELPELSCIEIRRQIERKKRQLAEVEYFLIDQAENLNWLEEYLLFLKDQLGLEKVTEGMGDIEGKVNYLKGYIPSSETKGFEAAADENHWGYQIAEPDKPDEVPVYVKNPKWIEIINPVMKFIDIVPGYKEVDVSIYFLVAFALFFAMLVGDAGYGLIFLLLSFFFRKKLSPQLVTLIYVLSGATMLWGILSGTYFGSEQIAAIPLLNDLIVEDIASFGVDNIAFMMHLSFLIGAIHLTVAHSIRMIQFSNSIRALSEVGWIFLVWGLFFVTEQLVLGKTMPDWGLWLFVAGASLVAFFSMESTNFLKSIGVSLANLPLSLISGFSDIVSYVRLFAVGMATAAVASSFNNMILPEGATGMGIINLLMAAIALLLGHGLNVILALMAVMVHGIRLNMLEFAGHLGVQFSGEAYKPFKLVSPKDGFDNKMAQSSTMDYIKTTQ